MKPFPHLVLFAAAAAACALPIDATAAGVLLFTAGLGAIIAIDYPQRYRGLAVPRLRNDAAPRKPTKTFRAPPLGSEPNRLAA